MRGIIALAAVAVVVAGVLLMSKSDAMPSPGGGASTPPAANPGTPKTGVILPAKIVIEAEEATTLDDKIPGQENQVIFKMGKQSEGVEIKYVEIPDGWIDSCGFGKIKGDAGKLPGVATYEFDAPRDDTYYISLRAKWLDSCGNSVWVKMDDSPYYNLEDQNGQISEKNFKWDWHQLYVGGKPKGFELKAGKHKLVMNTREDGPKLDQWVISTEATAPVGGAAKK